MQRVFRLPPLFTSLDLLLIVGLGALTALVYGYRWLGPRPAGQESGLQVVVRLEDEVVGRFALDADTSFGVTGSLGPVRIDISGGSVRFKDAPCPQKICEKFTAGAPCWYARPTGYWPALRVRLRRMRLANRWIL